MTSFREHEIKQEEEIIERSINEGGNIPLPSLIPNMPINYNLVSPNELLINDRLMS